MTDYPPKYLKELYVKLPDELKEMIPSEKTANNLWDICIRNNLTQQDEIIKVSKYTGYVLLGLLPPENLSKTLLEELKIEEDLAQKLGDEISQVVFHPIKNTLELLYQKEIKLNNVPPKIRFKKKMNEKDAYHEPIE